MNEEHILREINRTAETNGGVPQRLAATALFLFLQGG
jgi:hypothetical protein